MTGPSLAGALGNKAKQLMEGMRSRVKRDPDVADFTAAFLMILKEHDVEERNATDPEPRCLEKAQIRGDETFTLVGQDVTSPAVVCEWIKLNIETAPENKLRNALERAIRMRNRPKRKRAD